MGRIRDHHELSRRAGSREHERKGMVSGDGERHARSQVAPDLKGTRPEPTVSTTLSPIFYLFLVPSGKMYLKVQDVLAHNEAHDTSPL
jgi:hypothetical protein